MTKRPWHNHDHNNLERAFANRIGVPSGNAAIDRQRPGYVETYDRGYLLWLIAEAVRRRGADLEELADTADLTDAEIADVRTMID